MLFVVKMTAFWDIVSYSLVYVYRRFKGAYFFFYGASARFRAMASPTFFLHSSLSLATAFQFRIRGRLAASSLYGIFPSICRLGGVVVSVLATESKGCGFEPGQGDGFLRAIIIRSISSSRMGSKAGRSHVVRFYGM
jgi:hypothetical protein